MRKRMIVGMMLTLCVMSTLTVAFDLKLWLTDLPVRNVYAGWSYGSIQEAINAANPGDTIHVPSGEYYENVVVNKTVWLIGNGSSTTIIDGGGTEDVVKITANHTRIEGFTVQNAANGFYGLNLLQSHYNQIVNNRIAYNLEHGVALNRSNYNTIVDNNVTSNGDNGIYTYYSNNTLIGANRVTSNGLRGITIENSSYTQIANNTLAFNDGGILVLISSQHNVIFGNVVSNETLFGILVYGSGWWTDINQECGHNTISSNVVTYTQPTGIAVARGYNNTVNNNVISHIQGIGIDIDSAPFSSVENNVVSSCGPIGTGIYVSGASYETGIPEPVSITRNEVFNNSVGIRLWRAVNCSIIDNVLAANHQYGIRVGYSNYSLITQNELKDNGEAFPDAGMSLVWGSRDNKIYHNIFVNNNINAIVDSGPNSLDNGWPSGGNFWSDYDGVDLWWGLNQDKLGPDYPDHANYSIGDKPYTDPHGTWGPGNVDNYPLLLVAFTVTTEPLKPKMNEPYKLEVNLTNLKTESLMFILGVDYTKAYPQTHPLNWWDLNHDPSIPFPHPSQTYTVGPNETQEFTFNITNGWQWIKPANWVDYVIGYILGFIDPIHITDVKSFIDWCEIALTAVPEITYAIQPSADSNESITFLTTVTVEVSQEKIQYLFSSAVSQLSAIIWTAVATTWPDPFTKILAAALAAGFTLASYSFYVAAEDPHRTYCEVVQPMTIPVPDQVKSLPEGNAKRLALAALDLASLENATATSYARYQGAKDAGNHTCMELQLAAAMKYNDMATRKMQEVQFLSALATADIEPLNDTQMQQFWDELNQTGLPSLQQEILASAGLSDQIIYDLTQGILNATETPEQRELYKDPADHIKYTHHTTQSHYTEAYKFQATAEEENLTVQPEHDVAITAVWPSATEVDVGDPVDINVKVENYGNVTEPFFNVTVYYDDTEIETRTVPSLAPRAKATLTFTWDTADVSPGYYRIKAVADNVTGETFTADNNYTDGTVNVGHTIWREVAVVNIWPSIDWLDSVNYFWPYNGTHVQHAYGDPTGGDVLVSVVNYGSVEEVLHIELFAVFLEYRTHLTVGGWQVDTTNEIYLVDEWTFTLGAESGTGFSLWTNFQPPHKGVYALVAKIDKLCCADESTENNYMICGKPIQVFTDMNDYATYCADVDGSGRVDIGELFILGMTYYKYIQR